MKGLSVKRLRLESFLLAIVGSVVSLTLPAMTHSIPMGALAQPSSQQYYRIKLKNNGTYLDANFCTDQVRLFSFVNGACQLWRLVPTDDGYYRIQLKYNGKYLDANFCTNQVRLFSFVNAPDNGACQTWQFIPENI
ncbi:MAG TPA: RICIN domain-containing protein [Nostoc sp.]|uniref:RICIN domain-containing protein n=1 Tax=Nostoc sp. TaxID=1180 RepID=UPI002D27DB15|nr:RICIN domain-containing protein [Nostoc sp.]HYX16617.1 RICIN domain-containing protein [Nostoc sp.]